MNGKLQIKGLGTALKLLFTSQPLTSLRRTEMISLMNLMIKLSESLQFYENFLREEQQNYRKFYHGRWIVMVVIIRFINQVMDKLSSSSKVSISKKNETAAADGPTNQKAGAG